MMYPTPKYAGLPLGAAILLGPPPATTFVLPAAPSRTCLRPDCLLRSANLDRRQTIQSVPACRPHRQRQYSKRGISPLALRVVQPCEFPMPPQTQGRATPDLPPSHAAPEK